MLIEKNSIQLNDECKEQVIKSENLGVSFLADYKSDDYKSRVQGLLTGKNNLKKHEAVWPLKHIDFTGYKGEILGIIGSNGSGKTTLCKLISGILRPDEGQIQVDGKVSALFSFGLGFNKELTGRENVYLSGMMLGVNKKMIQRFIDEIHLFSGIGAFMDQPVKYYSSGMKARLGFSITAYLEPEILILDEALNTGDMEFGAKASEKMKKLVKKAKMVIVVTHSLGYAEANCDRLIWLDKGIIRAVGDPTEVVNQYKASVPPRKKKKKMTLDIQQTQLIKKDRVVIKAENVGVSFRLNKKTFWALKNLNLEIKEGEVVGIIGHNGAGKSTLCKLLTQILTPDTGKFQLNGETTSLLGYGTGFNAQLTGKDNVYLNGMFLGISKKKITRHYPRIVQFSELGKHIDKPVKHYSSGMKSRLGFSVAASLKPDIFIIDEALSAGDMAFRQKASEKIQEMIDSSKAVIIVSHSLGFVEKVCTRVIWLDHGEIRFDGAPEKGIIQYRLQAMKTRKKRS